MSDEILLVFRDAAFDSDVVMQTIFAGGIHVDGQVAALQKNRDTALLLQGDVPDMKTVLTRVFGARSLASWMDGAALYHGRPMHVFEVRGEPLAVYAF